MNRFVIGIGSQRAGSTLLHRILDECTEIFMHPVKELHYFDTLFQVRAGRALKIFSKLQIDRELGHIISARDFDFIDNRYRCYLRTNQVLWNSDIRDVEYLDLFHPCLSQHDVLGEITPEYMALPPAGVEHMRAELGPDTRIILLARHPVRRFLSAVKLLKAYRGENRATAAASSETLEQMIERMPGWMERQALLNDYEGALARYRSVFEHVLFMSYDRLVSDPAYVKTELESFLGVGLNGERLSSLLDVRVNSLGATDAITPDMQKQLEQRFKSSIAYLQRTFGSDGCIM